MESSHSYDSSNPAVHLLRTCTPELSNRPAANTQPPRGSRSFPHAPQKSASSQNSHAFTGKDAILPPQSLPQGVPERASRRIFKTRRGHHSYAERHDANRALLDSIWTGWLPDDIRKSYPSRNIPLKVIDHLADTVKATQAQAGIDSFSLDSLWAQDGIFRRIPSRKKRSSYLTVQVAFEARKNILEREQEAEFSSDGAQDSGGVRDSSPEDDQTDSCIVKFSSSDVGRMENVLATSPAKTAIQISYPPLQPISQMVAHRSCRGSSGNEHSHVAETEMHDNDKQETLAEGDFSASTRGVKRKRGTRSNSESRTITTIVLDSDSDHELTPAKINRQFAHNASVRLTDDVLNLFCRVLKVTYKGHGRQDQDTFEQNALLNLLHHVETIGAEFSSTKHTCVVDLQVQDSYQQHSEFERCLASANMEDLERLLDAAKSNAATDNDYLQSARLDLERAQGKMQMRNDILQSRRNSMFALDPQDSFTLLDECAERQEISHNNAVHAGAIWLSGGLRTTGDGTEADVEAAKEEVAKSKQAVEQAVTETLIRICRMTRQSAQLLQLVMTVSSPELWSTKSTAVPIQCLLVD
ncbi:hypothetical protein ACLX1H_011323 [Fusarium chlamydosporum]